LFACCPHVRSSGPASGLQHWLQGLITPPGCSATLLSLFSVGLFSFAFPTAPPLPTFGLILGHFCLPFLPAWSTCTSWKSFVLCSNGAQARSSARTQDPPLSAGTTFAVGCTGGGVVTAWHLGYLGIQGQGVFQGPWCDEQGPRAPQGFLFYPPCLSYGF
jgi:hypothetical protein